VAWWIQARSVGVVLGKYGNTEILVFPAMFSGWVDRCVWQYGNAGILGLVGSGLVCVEGWLVVGRKGAVVGVAKCQHLSHVQEGCDVVFECKHA
jgi:hypothetical protein